MRAVSNRVWGEVQRCCQTFVLGIAEVVRVRKAGGVGGVMWGGVWVWVLVRGWV